METSLRLERISGRLAQLAEEVQALKAGLDQPEAKPAAEAGWSAVAAFLALGPTLQQDSLLNTILRCAMVVTRAQGAGLTIFDSRKQKLVFQAVVGEGADELLGYEVPLEGSQHGLAFATGEIQTGTPIHRQADEVADTTFHQVLVAPLWANEQPIGTISAVNKQGDVSFTPQDMEVYAEFSDLAALVVRQRMREETLTALIEGREGDVPAELAGLAFGDREKRLLHLTSMLHAVASSNESDLLMLEQIVQAVAASDRAGTSLTGPSQQA